MRGGYNTADVQAYCAKNKIPQPTIEEISVDETTNMPPKDAGEAPDPNDLEVALDIQIAAASYSIATGKAAHIRIYWTKDIAAGIELAARNYCDVCSISWGADESSWGREAAFALEKTAAQATADGMVIFAASGDNDSSDGGPTPANVDLPASAPHVIGCGGTSKPEEGPEKVWNRHPGETKGEGTGGGYSTFFSMPNWQVARHGPGRMVPDVAANADPLTGYEIILNGRKYVVGGTSAVAPLYAGLFAAFGNALGFVTPDLYLSETSFADIKSGDNGAFRALVGSDPCTGLGAPIAKRLAELGTPTAIRARLRRELRDRGPSPALDGRTGDEIWRLAGRTGNEIWR